MAPQRKQRKLTNIILDEISGVDHPANLHEGWIVKKSDDAEPPIGATLISESSQVLVQAVLDQLEPGEETDWDAAGEGWRIGISGRGEPYLTTPESIEKAAANIWWERKMAERRQS